MILTLDDFRESMINYKEYFRKDPRELRIYLKSNN